MTRCFHRRRIMKDPAATRCREVFEQVADVPRAKRAGLLLQICDGDVALYQQVTRLLAAHEAAGEFLEKPPLRSGEPDPRHVGRYEIVRKLGEGGMGRVYFAEPGPVAIKTIRRDLDAELVVRRFARERDLLRRLVHPNISRLIEAGTTEDGTFYLVLAYVEGMQLDEYCERHALAIPDRLQLFQQLCRAVAFAHERLVVHRDLKPANILVTTGGTPVVLDFGLAKLTRTNLEAALDSTRTGHRLLTPEYASPEHVRGLRITSAADVYALGLILYELLARVRAHRFTTWSMAEIVDVVCHVGIAPPSNVAPPGERIDPELDFIVMKAIAKVPEHRYSHVMALDDDICRHLEGRPIPGLAGTR
jgi:eukaryotic-like serine/threonine-protein kinase